MTPSFTRNALAALSALMLLSACGKYVFTNPSGPPPVIPTLPAGIDAGGTGTANDPLSRLATPTSFAATAHQGLEITNLNGGLEATPTLSFDLTTTGIDMKMSDGTARFDTRLSSTHNRGTNTYRSCIGTCDANASVIDLTFNGGTANSNLTYVSYGTWTKTIAGATVTRFGAFAVGQPTTTAQMPTTGGATFTGQASGLVLIDGPIDDVSFTGAISLAADFAAKTVSGGLTNIATRVVGAPTATPAGTMNNISFTGGTITGTTFAGTATPVAALNPTVNLAGTVGQFNGAFYGPNASEAAGSFALSRNGLSLVGAFGVRR
ncbi:MAG: transferrin-binding protein-like solute binding protein [Rhodospirillaceae bacterium]|nr:transferrin-binding protein-like solute binding protein [Rhodospirillaceae bacterium]